MCTSRKKTSVFRVKTRGKRFGAVCVRLYARTDNLELTELNYQLLNTAAITAEEYRPASLSFAWDSSPENDHRTWLTKATETAYYNSARNEAWQLEYFLSELRLAGENRRTARLHRSELLQKNPAFLRERVFQKELQDKAQSILAKFSIGKLMISGETRYLSDDLMRLLAFVIRPSSETAYSTLMQECLSGAVIYAPQPSFPMQPRLTVLRNPHISRNEEVLATPVANVGPLREKYLSHLYYVAMVDSRTLISDRLGGADYDGDTVHIYADPILNECIRRNYEGGLENENNLPLLKIPDAEPLVADASDWRARFEAVKSTFSSRIGQISNAALRRSILAYDEHTEDWQRKRYRDETEILTILTGLEIDSAKTGVKPDLSEYLADQRDIRSRFLRYKQIVGDPDEHQWYEPTKYKRLQDYFLTQEWDAVTANLERTPLHSSDAAEFQRVLRHHRFQPEVDLRPERPDPGKEIQRRRVQVPDQQRAPESLTYNLEAKRFPHFFGKAKRVLIRKVLVAK